MAERRGIASEYDPVGLSRLEAGARERRFLKRLKGMDGMEGMDDMDRRMPLLQQDYPQVVANILLREGGAVPARGGKIHVPFLAQSG